MEVMCKIQASAVMPQEVVPVPTVQEDIWVSRAVMIFWRREGTLAVPTLDLNTFQGVT